MSLNIVYLGESKPVDQGLILTFLEPIMTIIEPGQTQNNLSYFLIQSGIE